MGKTKKIISNDKEEGQKKISNFFQKAEERAITKSSLFREVGSKSTYPCQKACKTDDDNSIVLSDSDEFINSKVKSKPKSERTQFSNSSLQNDLNGFIEKSTRTKTAESTLPGTDPMTIPETQFDFTPKGKFLESSKQNKMNSFISPSTLQEEILDSSIIPDTPENLKSEKQPKKKFSARSYLLSSSEFGSNPIQQAKENREAKLALKRKQVSAARKSLVSVSVNFNDNKSHGTNTNQQENKLGDTAVNGVTPTKVSENGFSLKRMAKSGVSPDPKRNSGSDKVDTGGYTLVNDGESKDHTIMKNLNFDEESDECLLKITDEITDNEIREKEIAEMNKKAALANERLAQKRKEKLEKLECEKQEKLQKQKQIAKEHQKKNTIRQMNYQLHGQTGMAKQEEKSVKDDDVLDNILDELNCSKTGITAATKATKQYIKLEKDSMKSADNKKDVQQPFNKRYSLDNVLKFGQDSLKDQTSRKVCQVSSGSKASDLLLEKLSSDWTEEDEALMLELDMKREIKKMPLKDVRNKHLNMCDAKKNDTIKQTSISSKDKVKSISKTISNVNKCDRMVENVVSSHEEMIVDSTQTVKLERKPDINDYEDIDEFMTQLDSEFICDKIENFTPFKDKRPREEEPTWLNKAPCVEFGRHIISRVERNRDQIVLEVLSQPGELNRKCYLHGNWQDAHVVVGDTVHILGEFKDAECHITDQCGFIIVNPDLLLSGTTVVGSVFCMRRSILKEKFKGCEQGNLQMLYGSILHGVFQEVLRKGLTGDQIFEEASKIVKQMENLLMIYSNDATEEKVMEEVKNYLPQIKSWTKKYTNIGKTGTYRPTDVDVIVTKVNDIEENIWSPRLGIKGKIDLTVDVLQKGENRTRTLPLELKTGRTSYSVEHKGQVTLYSMMSSDRRQDPGRGLLLYLKEPSMKIIPADQHSKSGLVQLRNEMAYYITRQVVKTTDDGEATYTLGTLPDPISNIRACEKCPQLVNCAIYQRDVEGRSVRDDSKGRLIQETLNHLSLTHIDYYTHWCLMLDLETQADRAKKTLSDIWCLSSNDREKRGACFSGMVIQTSNLSEGNCHVSFVRHQNNNRGKPLSSVGPVVTDSVVIGCESLSWIAICTGFIKQVSTTELQVYMDREGIERLSNFKEETFRIDLCDNFSTSGIFYTNVSRLMINEHRFEVLRSLIIEKMKPEFLNTLSKTHIEKVKGIFKSLNKPQKTAILKVLMSKHYVLIRGYPGTGKTSTIVAIVKVLNILGLSVLLTSYTHSAVDNILLKLKKDNLKFLRLGRISKVHPEIRDRCSDILTKNIKSVQALQTFFNSQMIVATSCLGTNHPLFSQRSFDVCIIDEASQVLQPACLGPLFSSKRFVLVGDPKQLPPVVQSTEARELGMAESLFVRLEGRGATFDLNLQYRMNSEIMAISNSLVYNNCLKCGTDTIANRTLGFPDEEIVYEIVAANPWMQSVFDPHLDKSVMFLNTEHIPAPEIREKGGIVKNEIEAKIVKEIVMALLKAKVESTDIGIIAPYRSQVFHIRNLFQEGQGHLSHVEVNTVDQYQGRDKTVIIISFVRSSSDVDIKRMGELLNDVRRLNVAVTRSKCKLVMVGNISVLQHYKPVKEIIDMSRNKQQIVNLPEGAIR